MKELPTKPTCGTCSHWFNFGHGAQNAKWRTCNAPETTASDRRGMKRLSYNYCSRWNPNNTDEAAYISEWLEAESAYSREDSE